MVKSTEQRLLQRKQQMAYKQMKRCSTSLFIRELQIKTTMRYHITLVRMAIISKWTSNKCWQRCTERGTHMRCWWECRWVHHCGKQYRVTSKNQKCNCLMTQWLHWLLEIYMKELETLIWKNIRIPMFIAALCAIAKIWKQPCAYQ